MATSKPIGPGAGAYKLPPTIGYDKHDNRKYRLPQYSMAKRCDLPGENVGPGSGAYGLDRKLNRYGISRANQITMAPMTTIIDKSNIGPGPGGHEVHLKPIFKGVRAPEYSMSKRLDFSFKNPVPGPDTYKVEIYKTKPGIPKYSIGVNARLKDLQRSPGPAAYGGTNTSKTLKRPPEYSMGRIDNFAFKQIGPGANNYPLMDHKPGKRQPIYSFGTYHNQYAPPMIVKCDNI